MDNITQIWNELKEGVQEDTEKETKRKEVASKWLLNHPGYKKKAADKFALAHPGYHQSYQRNYRRKIKEEVLRHYSKGELACVKCGFSDIRALCLDHINAGGTQHFKAIQKQGSSFYYWLKQEGYPVDYQTLCFNCNMIKRLENNENRKRKSV